MRSASTKPESSRVLLLGNYMYDHLTHITKKVAAATKPLTLPVLSLTLLS